MISAIRKAPPFQLWSMFVTAPAILYIASRKKLNKVQTATLIVLGVGTFLSAGYAYFKNEKDADS